MRELRENIETLAARFWERLVRRTSPSVAFWLCAAPLAALTAVLVARFPLSAFPQYRVGEVLRTDVVAPTELIVVDPERTARLRQEEARKIPPIFRFYPDRAEDARSALREYFALGREQFAKQMEASFGRRALNAEELKRRRIRARLETHVVAPLRAQGAPFPLTEEIVSTWALGQSGESVLARLEAALQSVMSRYIRPDGEPRELAENLTGEVRIVPAQVEPMEEIERLQEHPRVRASEVIPLAEARQAVQRALSESDARLYGAWLADLVRVNCLLAEDLTERLRRHATAHLVATTRYAPRQLIAARGQIVTPQIQAALEALRRQAADARPGRRALGLGVISLVFYYALWRFAARTRVYYLTPLKIFLLAAISIFAQLFIVRAGLAISSGIAYRLGTFDSPEGYQFAIPYAAAALVVAVLLESRLALVVGLLVSLLVGVLARDLSLLLYAAIGNIVAVYGVGRYQRRDTITRAGLIIGVANLGATGLVLLSRGESVVLGPILWNAVCGMTGGLLTAALAAFALPINESLFGIVTDVKLLELSNVELPLLKRLAIEAPGTYHHSLIVATLAEEAAKAIGAHALLVRVGSYYHDVGKLADPSLYIENQRAGSNPHDRWPPEESARRIIQHVSEGMRLAEQYGLPRQIVDLIPQHHGTRRLHYFYAKALERAAVSGTPVDERCFRYPGPKPQTIEAAIVMMCDSSEAAVRSLRRPTPEKIRSLVRRIIEDMVTDGQFDECNLRMRDLTRIRETIVQTLGTIYHERVPYPGFREEELVAADANYEAVPSLDFLRVASSRPDADQPESVSSAVECEPAPAENAPEGMGSATLSWERDVAESSPPTSSAKGAS